MFFIVVGVISVLLGMLFVYVRADRLKNAQPYIAHLINIEDKIVKTGGGIRRMYRAVVSYNSGTMQRQAHHHSYVYYNDYEERFDLGKDFTVYIDPRVGDVFYFPQEMRGKVGFDALAALLIGVFFIVVGIILASRGM